MFTPDPTIDRKRKRYADEYDAVFSQIMAAEKGSDEHLHLLEQEWKLVCRTERFLKIHAFYFSQRRVAVFKSLERKELYGERPEWEIGGPMDGSVMVECEICGEVFRHIRRKTGVIKQFCEYCLSMGKKQAERVKRARENEKEDA